MIQAKLDSTFLTTLSKISGPDFPALIFRWQKFPLEFHMIELRESPWEFMCIAVYFWRNGELRRRAVTISGFAGRLPFLTYGPDGIDPACLEKFFRLAHHYITRFAMSDETISAAPPIKERHGEK